MTETISRQVQSVALIIKNNNLKIQDIVDAFIEGNGIIGSERYDFAQKVSDHVLGVGLDRFRKAQTVERAEAIYDVLMGKAKGKKYLPFIFPVVRGIETSAIGSFYAISDIEEAVSFLEDPMLCETIVTLCDSLMSIEGKTAQQIFGAEDAERIKSSVTLFSKAASRYSNRNGVFDSVLNKYFDGKYCEATCYQLLNL